VSDRANSETRRTGASVKQIVAVWAVSACAAHHQPITAQPATRQPPTPVERPMKAVPQPSDPRDSCYAGVLEQADALKPREKAGAHRVEQSLDRLAVHAFVRQHTDAVGECFERGLARDPSLAGRVTMRWLVDRAGRVLRAGVVDTELHSPDVESCIGREICSWRFPPVGDGYDPTVVDFPWVFAPAPKQR
jgi:hypothetical protein